MKFLKYEFSQSDWNKLKSKLEVTYGGGEETIVSYNQDLVVSVVEIGFVMQADETLSSKYSVDILWQSDELADFAKYKVWPNPVGIHSFGASIDALYEEAYNNK